MVLYWWCIPRFADVADVRISASMAEPQDSKEVSLACPPPNPTHGMAHPHCGVGGWVPYSASGSRSDGGGVWCTEHGKNCQYHSIVLFT